MEKAFKFVFDGGLKYCIDYIKRYNSASSLLYNIDHFGIRGNEKSDVSADKLITTIICSSYAPYFFVTKKGSKYNLLYLWADSRNGDDTPRKNMQSNSLWIFTILKELGINGIIVKTDPNRGYDISNWVKKVSDIPKYVNNHKNSDRVSPGSIYIRVKITSSRYAIYEIYKKYYTSVIKDLDLLKIDYKII